MPAAGLCVVRGEAPCSALGIKVGSRQRVTSPVAAGQTCLCRRNGDGPRSVSRTGQGPNMACSQGDVSRRSWVFSLKPEC